MMDSIFKIAIGLFIFFSISCFVDFSKLLFLRNSFHLNFEIYLHDII